MKMRTLSTFFGGEEAGDRAASPSGATCQEQRVNMLRVCLLLVKDVASDGCLGYLLLTQLKNPFVLPVPDVVKFSKSRN